MQRIAQILKLIVFIYLFQEENLNVIAEILRKKYAPICRIALGLETKTKPN